MLIYAALDGWRRHMAEHGHSIYDRVLSLLAAQMADIPAADVRITDDMLLEQTMPPREAFFAAAEQVPVDKAAGRIAAEMLTPCPPGIPAALPGERLTEELLAYLHSGIAAGMVVPNAMDASLRGVRVVRADD